MEGKAYAEKTDMAKGGGVGSGHMLTLAVWGTWGTKKLGNLFSIVFNHFQPNLSVFNHFLMCSAVLHWCFYTQPQRDLVSPVCRILFFKLFV